MRKSVHGYPMGMRKSVHGYPIGVRKLVHGYLIGVRKLAHGYPIGMRKSVHGYPIGMRKSVHGYPMGVRKSVYGYFCNLLIINELWFLENFHLYIIYKYIHSYTDPIFFCIFLPISLFFQKYLIFNILHCV